MKFSGKHAVLPLAAVLWAAAAGAQTPAGAIYSLQNSTSTAKEYHHYVDFDQASSHPDRPYYSAWEHEVQGFRTYMDVNFQQQEMSPARCYDYTFVTTSGVTRPNWQFFINTGTAEAAEWVKVSDNAGGTTSPRVRLWISGRATKDRTVLRLSSANTNAVNNQGAAFLVVKEIPDSSTCFSVGSGAAGLVGFADNAVTGYFVGP